MKFLNRFKICFLFFILFLFEKELTAQENCGTDLFHERLLQSDSIYRIAFENTQRQAVERMSEMQHFRSDPVVYTIPVVVHVIHLGESVGSGSNISDAQIIDAIDAANSRFANSNGLGAEFFLEFCLASVDPDGNPTSGINRVNGSGVPLYSTQGMEGDGGGADEISIKNLSRWSNIEYYNIWVVHDIYGNIAGYAYYPTTNPLDGTVMDRNYMTATNTTLTHELGHAFGLRHTFEGDNSGTVCPTDSDCATQGDLICDTPPHIRNECGTSGTCFISGTWNNSRRNFMSYCSATNRFTAGQVDFGRSFASIYPRILLSESKGCGLNQCKDYGITTFNSTAIQNGNMFDITAINSVRITSFDGHFTDNADFAVYFKTGTHVGHQNLAGSWTLIGTASNVTAFGFNRPSPIPIPIEMLIPAGETYAFYITITSGMNVRYTTGTAVGDAAFQDENIILKQGYGNAYPFGTVFQPRIWNGIVRYSLENCCENLDDCDDNDPCTTDSCENGFCAFVPLDCDDGIPCTIDECVGGNCISTPVNCTVTIAGTILTENGHPVPNVSVSLSGDEQQSMITGSNGQYSFEVEVNGNYIITPSKLTDNPVSRGVSTSDITSVRRHVLSVQPLDSPYKIIAANADNNQTVSTSDITQIRALILGKNTSYNGRLWEFVNSSYIFSNPAQPYGFEKTRSYTQIEESLQNQNFIGIKLGDANGNWTPPQP